MKIMKRYQLVDLRDEILGSEDRYARERLVAYAVLRGKTYRQIESRTRDTIATALHGAGPSITREVLYLGVVKLLEKHGGLTKAEAEALAADVKAPPPDVPVPAPTEAERQERTLRAERMRLDGLSRAASKKEVA